MVNFVINKYLYALISRKHNYPIKVITGSQRYYIQSAYSLPSPEKIEQEFRPLRHIPDSFKKIVLVHEDILIRRDNDGIVTMGMREFMLNERSLEL